jgi:hypothetical protein
MLGNLRVSKQVGISRVVLSSMELVIVTQDDSDADFSISLVRVGTGGGEAVQIQCTQPLNQYPPPPALPSACI